MQIKIAFKNYKKINNLSAVFDSGNVYMVRGSNNMGKTSFIKGLLSTIEAKNKNPDPLSFGMTEGQIKTEVYNLKTKDGLEYTITFDFADEKKDKFTVIFPDAKKSNKVSDIQEIFQYNDFTVDDWFAWGTTAEGRRKQAKVIYDLLPKEIQDRINEIDKDTNTKNGILVEERKAKNILAESNREASNAITFTENELKMLPIGEKYAHDTDVIKKQYDDALINKGAYAVTEEKIKNLELERDGTPVDPLSFDNSEAKPSIEQQMIDVREACNTEVEKQKSEIKRLESLLADAKKIIEDKERDTMLTINHLAARKAVIETEIEKLKATLPKDSVDIDKLKQSLDTRKPYIDIYNEAVRKEKDRKRYDDLASAQKKEADAITEKIEGERAERIRLVAEANLPIKNIAFNEDEVLYVTPEGKELPFSEESVSYATGGLIIAELMLHINKKFPMLLLGKAAEYDKSSLDKLAEMAERNDAILVLDKVIEQENEPLSIECYEIKND